jgi:hypothetical protein
MGDAVRATGAARASVVAARERAKAEGKRVAVVFGASWCPDSRALEAAALLHLEIATSFNAHRR